MERNAAPARTIRLLILAMILAAGSACAETPTPEPTPDSPRQETPMTVLARATGPISLTDRPVTVTLEALEDNPRRVAAKDVRVILRDLHTDTPPGVLFEVRLGPKGEESESPSAPPLLGTFNFFGALPAASGDDGNAPAPERFFSFTLPGDSPLSLPLAITLTPRGSPDPAASPTVGAVELAWAGR